MKHARRRDGSLSRDRRVALRGDSAETGERRVLPKKATASSRTSRAIRADHHVHQHPERGSETMHRIRYNSLALAVIAICTVFAMGAGVAHATPVINAAKDSVRVFNDCPVTILNAPPPAYPGAIHFDENSFLCAGGINLHIFNLSDDGGLSSAMFNNKDAFTLSATITLRQLTGNTQCEAGLRVNPWWGPVADGVFNLRLPDGEIACFGGVLPFFSFTTAFGLHYQNGVPARE